MGDQFISEAGAWVEAVTGTSLGGGFQETLLTGEVLCHLINKIRPGTVKQINTYKATFKHMQNIENFLKCCKAFGVAAEDCFVPEDLYYGNNLVRVSLTVLALATAVHSGEGFQDTPSVNVNLDDARAAASSAQKADGKMRAKDSGLSIFESGAKNAQKQASSAIVQKDRMVVGSKDKAVATAELGMLDANASKNQKMVSEAKMSGTDQIIKSTEQSVASAELGMLDANASKTQKMVSEAKKGGTDKIIRSTEQAVASAELGMLDANASKNQKMVSEAKMSGTDLIIKSTEQSVATAELGMLDANYSKTQKMASDAHSNKLDSIIRHGDVEGGGVDLPDE